MAITATKQESRLVVSGEAGLLHKALSVLFAVAQKGDGELPVLQHILLQGKGNKLHATAFDRVVGATYRLGVRQGMYLPKMQRA